MATRSTQPLWHFSWCCVLQHTHRHCLQGRIEEAGPSVGKGDEKKWSNTGCCNLEDPWQVASHGDKDELERHHLPNSDLVHSSADNRVEPVISTESEVPVLSS
jgi:hypothetical protein